MRPVVLGNFQFPVVQYTEQNKFLLFNLRLLYYLWLDICPMTVGFDMEISLLCIYIYVFIFYLFFKFISDWYFLTCIFLE